MRYFPRRALLALLAATLLSTASGSAEANYLDDSAAFNKAISELRSAVGDHARILQITADPEGVEIEAQDPNNHSHIDRWRYGRVSRTGGRCVGSRWRDPIWLRHSRFGACRVVR